MSTHPAAWRRLWRASAVAIALVVQVGLGLAPGVAKADTAWGLDARSSQADRDRVVDALSRLPSLQAAPVDPFLRQVGFDGPSSSPAWSTLSNKEKVTQAWRWANAADQGDAFIGALVHRFDQQYESVRFDRELRPFLLQAAPQGALSFSRPTPAARGAPLPGHVESALNRLSLYVDVPGRLGRATVARLDFGLRGDALLEALEHRDAREMLRFAAEHAPLPPEIQERLNTLMKEVVRQSEAASADPELRQVAAQLEQHFGRPQASAQASVTSLDIDDAGHASGHDPSGGGGGGGGGGSPAREQSAIRDHMAFERAHYPEARSRSFRAEVGRAGGRGGVVAGAEVSVRNLGRPTAVRLDMPAQAECADVRRPAAEATLVIDTTSGQIAYGPMRCDIFAAAFRVVYGIDNQLAWQEGTAIGLASIALDKAHMAFPYFLPAGGALESISRRRAMLLHPGLVDLPVGRSIELLDLWPSAREALLRATSADRDVSHWLDELEKSATWKWTDSDVVLSASNGRLAISAPGRKMLLRMTMFTEDELVRERLACDPKRGDPALCRQISTSGGAGRAVATFDAAAPTLIRRVPEFNDAERLLRALAVTRWLKASGVPAPSMPLAAAGLRPRTPASIVIGPAGDWIAASAASLDWTSDCQAFKNEARRAAAAHARAPGGLDLQALEAKIENSSCTRKEDASERVH